MYITKLDIQGTDYDPLKGKETPVTVPKGTPVKPCRYGIPAQEDGSLLMETVETLHELFATPADLEWVDGVDAVAISDKPPRTFELDEGVVFTDLSNTRVLHDLARTREYYHNQVQLLLPEEWQMHGHLLLDSAMQAGMRLMSGVFSLQAEHQIGKGEKSYTVTMHYQACPVDSIWQETYEMEADYERT